MTVVLRSHSVVQLPLSLPPASLRIPASHCDGAPGYNTRGKERRAVAPWAHRSRRQHVRERGPREHAGLASRAS
ncbi:Nucleus Accumbens-Associated Protein 2 [Manis pentadactyla]|nr:Nucleus Accumbens-Associated Protein 2 [Manis pentadactyla]